MASDSSQSKWRSLIEWAIDKLLFAGEIGEFVCDIDGGDNSAAGVMIIQAIVGVMVAAISIEFMVVQAGSVD
jgi:hypothetical protein